MFLIENIRARQLLPIVCTMHLISRNMQIIGINPRVEGRTVPFVPRGGLSTTIKE